MTTNGKPETHNRSYVGCLMASRISMRVEEEEMERSPAADCPLKQNSDQCYSSVMSHIFNSNMNINDVFIFTGFQTD